MDSEVVLEALSALIGAPVKPSSGKAMASSDLNILNFLSYAMLKHYAANLLQAFMAGFDMGVVKEMFVDMDEFFDPQYDYDFRNLSQCGPIERGGEKYVRPAGWYRVALKVLDKYPDGNRWLGSDGWRSYSVPGEWPVSYHGTSAEGARGIVKNHYVAGSRVLYGRGIYSTYDLEQASGYSKEFTSKKNGKKYRVIMQNRINPEMREVCAREDYWLIPIPAGTSAQEEKRIVEKSIRPYGILLKEV